MEIKGDIKRGLRLIARGFDDEAALLKDLEQTLTERESFLRDAVIEVEVADFPLSPNLLFQIAGAFDHHPNLGLAGVVRKEARPEPIPLARRLDPPLVIRHTLRSGQHQYHQGDLIVIGDVNPGATLTAAGDIMVFGRLRGSAHAGHPQDLAKGVYALAFTPTQVRIGTLLAIGETSGRDPEYAHVDNGRVVVEVWKDLTLPEVVTQETKHRRSHLANPS